MNTERGRKKFNKYRGIINFFSLIIRIFPMRVRKKMLVCFRTKKGMSGIALRYIILKTISKQIGDNVCIYENVWLLSPENLVLGNNVSIHPMCYIDATGGIKIGNDVSIAHMSTVMSTTHIFCDINVPIKDQGCEKKHTVIEDDVWIGAKATILYGVKISQGSIIGANSLVNKDTSEFTVSGGVPAKVIKERV